MKKKKKQSLKVEDSILLTSNDLKKCVDTYVYYDLVQELKVVSRHYSIRLDVNLLKSFSVCLLTLS